MIGSICEQYTGAEEGLYHKGYMIEDIEEFTYTNDMGDFIFRHPTLPSEFDKNTLKQVQIIVDEIHYAYLYFILIDEAYYLWIEDLCDCSA